MGGNDQVTTPLAERQFDRLHLDHALEGISETSSGAVRLRFSGGVEVEGDQVILTLPFTNLRFVRR